VSDGRGRVIVVDDGLLLRMLSNGAVMVEADAVATTCAWWWRLAARLGGAGGGPLARRLAHLDPAQRRALARTVADLPEWIAVPERRELVPAMAALAARFRLDPAAAEAVVAAEVLDAELVLATDVGAIRTVAAARGVAYRVEP
jgi:hypothetical protein